MAISLLLSKHSAFQPFHRTPPEKRRSENDDGGVAKIAGIAMAEPASGTSLAGKVTVPLRPIQRLLLPLVSFKELARNESRAIEVFKNSLRDFGVVRMGAIPYLQSLIGGYLEAQRAFAQLSLEDRSLCCPNQEKGYFLGAQEDQKEKALLYYAYAAYGILDCSYHLMANVWPDPKKLNLEWPFSRIAETLFTVGKVSCTKTGCLGKVDPSFFDELSGLACSVHHQVLEAPLADPAKQTSPGLAMVLCPWQYFKGNECVKRLQNSGLFIETPDGKVYEMASQEEDEVFFIAGEFGQLLSNGQMKAPKIWTERPLGLERLSMGVTLEPNPEFKVQSTDELAQDPRYKMQFQEAIALPREDGFCQYKDWIEANSNA